VTYLLHVITDEVEIAGLLYFGQDPCYRPESLHSFDELLPLADTLVLSGLCASKSEARRLISQGGAYAQNTRCGSDQELWSRPLIHGRYLLLRRGRHRISLLEISPDRILLTYPGNPPASYAVQG
jgi:tyrosyl-tRNA synthetase